MSFIEGLYQWVLSWADTPYGAWALFGLATAESSFFPIPPDVLLIALCLQSPASAFVYATVCSVGSVIGGVGGYVIGFFGGKPLALKLFSKEKIQLAHDFFQRYEEWAIGIAGFTPVPYKIFTISAGVFYINFIKFIIVSALSRSARFFLVATVLFFFGDIARKFIEKYFNLCTIAFVVLVILGFVVIKYIPRPKKTV